MVECLMYLLATLFIVITVHQSNCSKILCYMGKSEHIDVRFHFMRNITKEGAIQLVHCSLQDQLLNIMTKPLSWESFCKLRDKLEM